LCGRVSFFGVRHVALVDMPETAAELLQRVGRAVRFNGHAGLPSEKSNVRLRLYCATLPAEAAGDGDDGDEGASKPPVSADGKRKDELARGLSDYECQLKKLYATCAQPVLFALTPSHMLFHIWIYPSAPT
jgi:hypothetical protein